MVCFVPSPYIKYRSLGRRWTSTLSFCHKPENHSINLIDLSAIDSKLNNTVELLNN